ncbi:MAG: CRISPR-associated endoribonuclease Cas6 [Spirochaetota bacterium]|nr:CRISPR-associated endoribonuclease Cas6 [Spirochaetota bacterium]
MRVTFYFSSKRDIILPVSYNELIQAMIYRYLEKDFATFLHEKGYEGNGRTFKLFCFSQITSPAFFNFNKHTKTINFGNRIEFTLSTSVEKIAISFVENQMKSSDIFLGNNNLILEGIKVHTKKTFSNNVVLKVLSPITVYSTLSTPDNKSKTYYYSPTEPEFEELIYNNLIKKLHANLTNFNDLDFSSENNKFQFNIKKYDFRKNQKTTQFKGFYIKGYTGIYELIGHPTLIELAYNTGLGSKNSMGFGYWEIRD